MDLRTIMSVFAMLQRKSTWVVILACAGGYFMFEKYESKIVEKVPQAKQVKEKIDAVKQIVS